MTIFILLPIYILLIVLGSSVSVCFLGLLIYVIYRKKQMKKRTYDLLEEIAKENKNLNYKVYFANKHKPFDLYLETLTHIYYVKLLPNYDKSELYLENEDNIFLVKKVNGNPKKIDLKAFIRFKPEANAKKDIIKLLLIYPNAKAIISYINQCELNFVYDDKEIYGLKILTYENLYNRHNIIEGR